MFSRSFFMNFMKLTKKNLLFCKKFPDGFLKIICYVQLNEYETDPYFLQLGQNTASDCLFTFVFFPEFTCFVQKIALF